jgi:ABC-type bacteriocin/lantibiotic exporter with double-glycine peptidase domain
MLNNSQISRILHEVSLQMRHLFEDADLRFVEINNRSYATDEFPEFKRDLLEAGNKIKLLLMEYSMPELEFSKFIDTEDNPVLVFKKNNDELVPALITPNKKKHTVSYFLENELVREDFSGSSEWLTNENGQILFFIIFSYKALVSEHIQDQDYGGKKLTPVTRLWRMLLTEKKDILYILFYGILVGLIGLVLPLGIQTTVELISGGVFFSSVYLLISIVILGVLISGGLQIIQISLVEYLQRRIFTKASFEFAFRIPRMQSEAIINNYAPELINRFFDIMTIQKALPKILIDLSAGVIQIFFGLLLLSLYHPSFVFFSAALVASLTTIFYLTGAKGLDSSIQESKYKYKVAQWLEELGRVLNSFKLAGNTDLPLKRTDTNVNKYLLHRRAHFTVLVTQYSFMVIFKAIVTGGLLIVGTILVINREITLGQFVASEVIIILTLSAVEKIITYMDVVYDLLTAVDKVAQVTDIPLEKSGGIDLPKTSIQSGYAIDIKDLKYKYPEAQEYSLKGISMSINAGEHMCISGPGGSGKTTLMNIISGIHAGFEGIVTINNYSIRDLDLTHLRDKIGKNISQDDIFDGTILENITVGKPMESVQDAIHALQQVNLYDDINRLPNGLNTHLVSGGKGLSNSFAHKLILARCLAKKPSLIILNDFFTGLKRTAKIELIQCLVDKSNRWTVVAVSNDPLIMAACDRVVVLNDGAIEAEGQFEELLKEGRINNYID